ncbi:protein kinase [Streptomyces sp. NPDC093094]|uniref:serine/threonine-protein kinase n=1 Tax=Streptomyces sp. NPDC093094 TaxID=3366026 RepID=UPI00381C4BAE
MALRDSDPAEVGGYLIEDRLGSGGMGVVYLARSASGRRLAVKVVHDQYADDDEFRTRFRRELSAARQVSGAFTAPVVDADADAPRPWMATLHIPGETLGHHVREHGPLPLPRLRELAAGLAEALRDIHRAGVVHRDLKPANVMLAEDGPRVIDFGISRAAEIAASDALTQTGRVMGTPPFMSPEQLSAPHHVGPAADVFSLGAVLAYAATGRGPFDSASPYETAVRVVEGDPELDGVPDELLPCIRLCLEKEPTSRPTAHELLTKLGGHAAPSPRGRSDVPRTASPSSAPREWPAPPLAEWPDSETVPKGPAGTDAVRTPDAPNALPQEPQEPGAPAPARNRLRGRPGLLGWGAAAVVLAAVAVSLLSLPSQGGQGTARPGAETAASDLPEGWRPWRARAADQPAGAGFPFGSCAATDRTLVCAGDDLTAAGWNLSDGKRAWSRYIDPTPNDEGRGQGGAVLGLHRGAVLVYGADDPASDEPGTPARYTLQSLDPATGRVNWTTVTGEGEWAIAPQAANTAVVPEGVLTLYGDDAGQYALVDADDGEVRWKRRGPATDYTLEAAAGAPYLFVQHDWDKGDAARTEVVRLDPATGEARWKTDVEGRIRLLGESGGGLVLAHEDDQGGQEPVLTLLDPGTRAVTSTRLSPAPPDGYRVHVAGGTVYLTWSSGTVRAFSPHTGRRLWENNSTVEHPGPPAVSARHVYVASSSGRMASMDIRTGEVEATRPGYDDAVTEMGFLFTGAAPLLVGDALYVPYGARSVYTVDVNEL